MTGKETIEQKLEKLGQAIGSNDALVKNVMRQIDTKVTYESNKAGKLKNKLIRGRFVMNRFTKLAAAAVIVIAALIGIYYFGGSIDGTSAVYAAAIKALQKVNTVHISGWTTRLYPGHSGVLDEPLDTSKHYPVEIWEWFTENGEYRKYERQGPITVWDDGERCYEYQAHKDTLYIDKSTPHRLLSTKFQSMTDDLESLKERGIKMTELGIRIIDGRETKGLKTERDDRRYDIWIDTQTKLVVENNAYTLKKGQWSQLLHRSITYDQKVPPNIRAYVPPETAKVEYSWDIAPRFEKWHLHLRKIAAYYQKRGLPETMELLPRQSDEKIDAYAPGRLPGITKTSGHWVLPIQSYLCEFLRGQIRPSGSLRLPEDLHEIKLNHDLVTRNEHTPRQRADFVLDALGLEIVETTENRKVWVAHYDGRPLKLWREVKAPVPNPEHVPLRPGMASVWSAWSLRQLFDNFAYYQDYNLTANKLIIIDETDLPSEPATGQRPESVAVSSESPYWGGEESIEIAKKWFKEQFGVTFTEETRPMTVYVVQKCQ